ncbi:unnamed protein product [Adineta steineri]|uniref:Histone H2A C-terminal domain-containing protein n=1 Tax=Adineta steineri TaxID=433720 RepID=A0A820SBE6_9BILA|nr:unnamed protein product [Adineta steineri]
MIPQGGVLPSILPALLSKGTGDEPSQSSTNSSPKVSIAKKTKGATTVKAPARKPALTKTGLGSFTVFSAPKSKAVALKGTAVTTLSERVLNRGQKACYTKKLNLFFNK